MPKTLSCGLLIISPAGWLLAHATRSPRWDIPKGHLEPGETRLEAALRETWEETGLDMKEHVSQMKDLGRHAYLRSKDLHLFRLDLPEAFDLSDCRCHMEVSRSNGETFPETDRWEWVGVELVPTRVGAGLLAYMQALDLIDPSIKHNGHA